MIRRNFLRFCALRCSVCTERRTCSTDEKNSAPPSQSTRPEGQSPPELALDYRPSRFAGRAGTYYRMVWGIEGLSVKSAEAGEVIRFTYQVLDPAKAKMLNDKKIEPSLIDEQAQCETGGAADGQGREVTPNQRSRSREERIGCCSRTRADMSSAETRSVS